ncbi:MAG TPA: hypothetical protein ENI64_04440 [Gammaproteobacteria bacterium]|nr:hypothetical protein [Gammaproteobacteria bacterium]
MKKKSIRPSPLKILLDLTGTAIALIGIIDYMKLDVPFIPEAIRYPGQGLTLIVIGIALMIVSGALFVRQDKAARNNESQSDTQSSTVDRG